MSEWLRRNLAPLAPEAWEEIENQATQTLKGQLSARALVDFDGPHGFSHAAVNLGRLDVAKKPGPEGVPWGIRQVLPLVEVRIPISLDQMEMDCISRGTKDPDLEPVAEAAGKLAIFEETAIYKGFAAGQIKGILESSTHKPVNMAKDADQMPAAVAEAVKTLGLAGIAGPYALVLGTESYYRLMQSVKTGYPPSRVIKNLVGGEVLWSPVLDGGVLLSRRGGDFQLTVGQDIAIGYASHDRNRIELYLIESFTFRVLEPAAAVKLKLAGK